MKQSHSDHDEVRKRDFSDISDFDCNGWRVDIEKEIPANAVPILENFDTDMQEEQETSRLPLNASTTALLIVDVQPEYWSRCPAVRKDFPNFEENLQRTIATARKQNIKIIWVRADYTFHHSPWLKQFERLKNSSNSARPNTMVELPCDPNNEDFGWEPFATPEYGEVSSEIV